MKKVFILILSCCIMISFLLYSRKNTAVMGFLASLTGQNTKNVVVIDPGHPATSLGTENKTRPCVSMGDAL